MRQLLAALLIAVPGVAGAATTFSGPDAGADDAALRPAAVIAAAQRARPLSLARGSMAPLWTAQAQGGDRLPPGLNAAFELGADGAPPVAGGIVRRYAPIDWDDPMEVAAGGGGALSVALQDADIDMGLLGLSPGTHQGEPIRANFTFVSPSMVPVPPALGLLLAGMATLAAAGLRRSRRAD